MIAPQQVPCRGCNESVPVNCVRCRFCQTFLRDDIEDYYTKLQSAPRPVTYSDSPTQDDSANDPAEKDDNLPDVQ